MYRRVASAVVGGVSLYLYARGDKLYAVLRRGSIRRIVYLGRLGGGGRLRRRQSPKKKTSAYAF